MKVYIVRNPAGVFAVDEKKKVLDKVMFKGKPAEVAKKIISDKVIEEEKVVIERLKKKGYKKFILSRRSKSYDYEENNPGERFVRENFRKLAGGKNLNATLTEIGIEITKMTIKRTVKKDKIVVQAINTLDEIDKSINIFVERLREWYGFHFPEFEKVTEKHEKFVKIIAEYGLRDDIEDKEIAEMARKSMGLDLSEADGEIIKIFAGHVKNMYKLRDKTEKYIGRIMKEIAPNFSELAGPLLAARLVSLSGGMEKLAKKPSSTIQLLGSEKALFRYLKGKGKSPKHGVLFQSPYIQQAHPAKRGKIARVVSSKLNIAVKMDYYGSEDKSKELKKALDEAVKKASEDRDEKK